MPSVVHHNDTVWPPGRPAGWGIYQLGELKDRCSKRGSGRHRLRIWEKFCLISCT